jgi:glycosyltransferase involved in cell wall biosynthesis
MKINILLPYKEKFDKFKLSAVSVTVKNNLKYSKFKNNIMIYGQNVSNPIAKKNFNGIKKPLISFSSKNKYIAKKMCEYILTDNDPNQLIEIHNRPYLFHYIIKKINKYPISIFFHNDPLQMKGSKSVKERKELLSKANFIFCVSEFIKNKFLVGIHENKNKVVVIYNGVDRKIINKPKKYKEVLFVGRLVPEKGVRLYVNAVKKIIKYFPDYKFYLIGSSHLGSSNKNSTYAQNIIKDFTSIGENAVYEGYRHNDIIQKKMQRSSLVIVPSIWEEPFGLVVAEAMSNGAAIITSNVGGIPEIIGVNGIIIEEINEKKLIKQIKYLLSNSLKMETLQNLSWQNFSHTSVSSSNRLDDYRKQVIDLFSNNK